MKSFDELDAGSFAGSIALIDIDGTLTHDGGANVTPSVAQKLQEIAAVADVYFVSNSTPERTRLFADTHGVHALASAHRKPSRRVAEDLPPNGKQIVVIGDKALTDGVFAANIGARFVPVRRVTHAEDTIPVRALYMLDALVSPFIRDASGALPYVSLMRPSQWIKNLLVFAPVFFADAAFHPQSLLQAFAAFFVFSAAASTMYVYNDISDVARDRTHPSKRFRPIANGGVILPQAWTFAGFLLLTTIATLAVMPHLAPVIVAYVVGNIAYTRYLKHVAIMDIVAVASFYVVRVIGGGIATDIRVSPWLILCVFFGALFLVVGKRRAEFVRASSRAVLAHYSLPALDNMATLSAGLAIISYGLYGILAAHSPYAVYTAIFVIVAVLRLLNRMYDESGNAEYPETLLFKDRWVLAAGIGWIASLFILMYTVS